MNLKANIFNELPTTVYLEQSANQELLEQLVLRLFSQHNIFLHIYTIPTHCGFTK